MKYDVTVIGSGPGGYTCAIELAKHGKKVAVIEKDKIGGICLNTGCIPTKTLVASAALIDKISRANELGIIAASPAIDWTVIMERKEEVINRLRSGIISHFKKYGITVIEGEAEVDAKGRLSVAVRDGKEEIDAGQLVIATGARKSVPSGFESFMRAADILSVDRLPSDLDIIGAGPVGLEFASIFSAFGTKVRVHEMMDCILPGFDRDISAALESVLVKKGIEIHKGKKADPSMFDRNRTLMAAEKASGFIVTDDHMRTPEGHYAIGDVTGRSMYAHTAYMHGLVAAANILGSERKMDHRGIPACVFTMPEIASVGLSEQQARAEGVDAEVRKGYFLASGKALADGEKNGFVKLVSEKQSRKLIGGHIIGENASNIVQELVLAVRTGLTLDDLARTVHSHPTLPEVIWETSRS